MLIEKTPGMMSNNLQVLSDKVSWTEGAALMEGFHTNLNMLTSKPSSRKMLHVKHALKGACILLGLICLISIIWRGRKLGAQVLPEVGYGPKISFLPMVPISEGATYSNSYENEIDYTRNGMAKRRQSQVKLCALA